jgi:hypothetical protein
MKTKNGDQTNDNEINDKIAELFESIQSIENLDPVYLTESIKKLRHHVMQCHMRAEYSIEILISRKLTAKITNQSAILSQLQLRDFHVKFSKMLDDMTIDYTKKVIFSHKNKLISKKLKSSLMELNNVRKYFSHPKTYASKILNYKHKKNYLIVLELVDHIYKELDKIFYQTSAKNTELGER